MYRIEPKTGKVKVASGSPSAGSLTTFWTACPKCQMQSEYPRKCIKRRICCYKCGKMFVGTEIPAPSRSEGESSGVLPQAAFRRNLRIRLAKDKKCSTAPEDSVPAAGKPAGLTAGEQVACAVQPSKRKPKRRRDEATEVSLREDVHRGKFSSSDKAVIDLSDGAQKSSKPVLHGIDLNKLPSEAEEEPSTCGSDISVKQKETLDAILRIMRMVAKKR